MYGMLHADTIDIDGGSQGGRIMAFWMLQSRCPASNWMASIFIGDIAVMAAAYLFHIAHNPLVVDGNKRTASMASLVFLHVHGVERLPGSLGPWNHYATGSRKRAEQGCPLTLWATGPDRQAEAIPVGRSRNAATPERLMDNATVKA